MKTYLIPLVGAVLGLAACSDNNEPSQMAKPMVQPTVAPSPMTAADRRDIDRAKVPVGSDATVTETDKQKNGTPGASGSKTGLLVDGSAPMMDGASTAGDARITTTAGDRSMTTDNTQAPMLTGRDPATKQEAVTPMADNSAKNAGDDNALLTPLDQGNSESDRMITQGIRKAVVAQESLSINAKNVKIIAQEGVVTLRGPVADARERDLINSLAMAQPGIKSVNNQLEPIQK